MKYIKNELYKLNKSRQGMIGYLLVLFLMIGYTMLFLTKNEFRESVTGGIEFSIAILSNISHTYILFFIIFLMTSFIFAKEFESRTYVYIFIRPVSWASLFTAKIAAVMIYFAQIIITVLLVSLLTGVLVWGAKPIGSVDLTMAESVCRLLYYYLSTWFNMVFLVSLCALVSVILKSQISTIIVSFAIFLSLALAVSYIPDILIYNSPTLYLFLVFFLKEKFQIFSSMFYKGILICSVYSIILGLIAYVVSYRMRRGEINV